MGARTRLISFFSPTSAQRQRRGFTLMEMAVSLVAVGMVAGLAVQLKPEKSSDACYAATRAQMNDMKLALLRYAQKNERLPLPASDNSGVEGTIGTGEVRESTDADPNKVVVGNFPFAAVGLSRKYLADCFDNAANSNYRYVVSKRLTVKATFKSSGAIGVIKLKPFSGGTLGTDTYAYGIISRGKTGNCGSALGASQSNCAVTPNNFLDNFPFNLTAKGAGFFDAVVVYGNAAQTCSGTVRWNGDQSDVNGTDPTDAGYADFPCFATVPTTPLPTFPLKYGATLTRTNESATNDGSATVKCNPPDPAAAPGSPRSVPYLTTLPGAVCDCKASQSVPAWSSAGRLDLNPLPATACNRTAPAITTTKKLINGNTNSFEKVTYRPPFLSYDPALNGANFVGPNDYSGTAEAICQNGRITVRNTQCLPPTTYYLGWKIEGGLNNGRSINCNVPQLGVNNTIFPPSAPNNYNDSWPRCGNNGAWYVHNATSTEVGNTIRCWAQDTLQSCGAPPSGSCLGGQTVPFTDPGTGRTCNGQSLQAVVGNSMPMQDNAVPGSSATATCTQGPGGPLSPGVWQTSNPVCPAAVNGVCNNAVFWACSSPATAVNLNWQPDCGYLNTWTCPGSGGGANASCSKANDPCPDPVNGVCSSVNWECISGTPYNGYGIANGITWTCLGANGGTNDTCVNASINYTYDPATCENFDVWLTCPANTRITVTQSTYGGNDPCNQPINNEIGSVSGRCNGSNSCNFIAGNNDPNNCGGGGFFGDPCFEIPKSYSVSWRCSR